VSSVERLVQASRRLRDETGALAFAPPVACVYHPLEYAWAPHELYLRRFGAGPKEAVLVGMNPGPFGMAQTGVPFGDPALVAGWLGVHAPVGQPRRCHPKRPVSGFDASRAEVSGARLWGWARDRFGTPERFFARFFVVNYCPLLFVEASGKNRTPEKLPAKERAPLFAACDRALAEIIAALAPAAVIGVGTFAEERARAVLPPAQRVGRILHPSPASPAANRGWPQAVEAELTALGVGVP
jgi:single-strand selective monofunctional uracil DNA glycosylase